MKKLKFFAIIISFSLFFRTHNAFALSKIVLGPNSMKYKGNLFCPLDKKYKGLTSNFGYRSKGFHEGVDMKAATNTNIYASHSGVVVVSKKNRFGYGNMVVIKGRGIMTVYSHNNRNLVRVGDKVEKGERIALVGSTGRSTGPHLHFEIRVPVNKKWYAVNPNFFKVCR
ncbi:MAG: M23 family metallopeptidase [Bdellovibrionota bacterium]